MKHLISWLILLSFVAAFISVSWDLAKTRAVAVQNGYAYYDEQKNFRWYTPEEVITKGLK